jgi:hypothetical protein
LFRKKSKVGFHFFFYNPYLRCNHNDLTCQKYIQRITYLSQRRAGYLVEKLSGMGFGEFLRTRLFEPLGMRDTAF